MESIDKVRVLLKHWIDHNGGHVAEFAKWRKIMADENRVSTAEALQKAIEQMDAVSATLQAALDEIGGGGDHSEHHHHDHHHHH
jgi:hypothetical protein